MSPNSALSRAFCALLLAFVLATGARGNPIITEFMADNVSLIADEDGAFSDWIEIHNPGASAVVLTDWALTDEIGRAHV